MLTTAALLGFMQVGLCNIWIVMIVLTREFAVTSVRLIASAEGVVIPANIWGKLKTVSQNDLYDRDYAAGGGAGDGLAARIVPIGADF